MTDDASAAAETLLGTRGAVDLTLTRGYHAAINMAHAALQPEMEPGRVSSL